MTADGVTDAYTRIKSALASSPETPDCSHPEFSPHITQAVDDRLSKYDAYARAGVPEYWLVYPKIKSVEVLLLEAGRYSSLGIFGGKDKLPSHILPGLPVEVELFFVSVWS